MSPKETAKIIEMVLKEAYDKSLSESDVVVYEDNDGGFGVMVQYMNNGEVKRMDIKVKEVK